MSRSACALLLALLALTAPLAGARNASAISSDLYIYNDSLHWSNWSWRSSMDFDMSTPVSAGSKSLKVTFLSAWAAASFHTSGRSTSGYSYLAFDINSTTGTLQSLTAALHGSNGAVLKKVNIAPYASASAGGWRTVAIPLQDLDAADKTISRVSIQDASGSGGQTFYVDELRLTASSPNPPGPDDGASYVYDDFAHWSNWSWRSSLNFNIDSPVMTGSRSLRVTYNGGWAGASFHTSGLNTSGFSHFAFDINPAGRPVPDIQVMLYGAGGMPFKKVKIGPYVSTSGNGWHSVDIPLSALNAEGRTVTRVSLQEADGSAQPAFYVDNLRFVSSSAPEPCTSGVSVPQGLPAHFALGLGNRPEDIGWMTGSGIPWDFRYQYLTGDVTASISSGSRWTGWNSPAGQFATYYIENSHEEGFIPVFTYYTLVGSSPNQWSENPESKLASSNTMRRYFEDWKLLMMKAGESGETVVVHHEPDTWGYIQRMSSNPENVYVAVEDSGFSEVSGFANNASGFAKALVAIRDKYAPNVVLAWHASHWANRTDFTVQGANASPTRAAEDIADFYNALDADFDLIFTDPSDRDWGYLLTVQGEPQHVWTDETFNRFRDFSATLNEQTGLPIMLWQLPLGNTVYRSVNNTSGHYQDNAAQYFLEEGNREHIEQFADAGVIGILFGRGNSAQTSYMDSRNDGVTNPSPINGNGAWAQYADDDGGFLRLSAKAYYQAGMVPLEGC